MLDKKQTNYIFKKAMDLTNYWTEYFPASDEDWIKMKQEAEEIVSVSKNDPLCRRVIVSVLCYFIELSKLNKAKEGVE